MRTALVVVLCFIAFGISGQQLSQSDYDRAISFRWKNLNNKKVFNLYITPHWFDNGVWFVDRSPNTKKYLFIDFKTGKRIPLFNHSKVAKALSSQLGEEIDANVLPINRIEKVSADTLDIDVKGKKYALNLKTYHLTERAAKAPKEQHVSLSKSGKIKAFSRDYNLFIEENGTEKQLSTAGKKGYEYASWYGWYDIMKGEGGTRPQHFWSNWSADDKWIYTTICDMRTANKMYLLDWSQDTLYRPELLSYYRGSPGDTNMVYDIPVFFNVETGEEIVPPLPRGTHINSVSMQWAENSEQAFFYKQTRGYQSASLYQFNLKTRSLKTLYSEKSATNIDNFSYKILDEQGLIFILSEKSGWRQLYALNIKSGKTTALTKGRYYIHSIKYVDEANKRIFFAASGREKGANPYHYYLYSIGFDGSDLRLLTPEKRHHQTRFSKEGKYFVDNFSTADEPTVAVLRNSEDGKVITELGRADISALKNWQAPQTFTATARDGKTTIYGALWKPTNFDANKKYPIIDHSYTGPHTQMYPKDFKRTLSIENQALAELGFIVVMVDGLGSAKRSKQFHNWSYKNLGGNLEDHVIAMRQLAQKYSWIDTTRVGIYGHSAGGYDAAHALMVFPEFYKVAVASSADHDHRMEKAWWPEMYMGWPVDSAYHKQSNITLAANLKGKLLLVHGGIDENVNPSATFKLAEALIKANKEFDLLIIPSQRHGYRGAYWDYFLKKRWNYFVQHLLDKEPRWDIGF